MCTDKKTDTDQKTRLQVALPALFFVISHGKKEETNKQTLDMY